MYADFFGLKELPFNNTPDPRFFYSTPDHEEALASLIYAVRERKGFALLTGEVGAGKTLVSRMMLRHFGSRISFASINHAVAGAGDLMEAVCGEFELDCDPSATNAQTVRALHDYLLVQFSENTPVVLVLDEAQSLPVEAFEQLRMIGNLEADDAKLLQIIIVGQPELQRRFASRELRQLRQRIFRAFHLPALTRETTEGYILHRLAVAAKPTEKPNAHLFDRTAIDAVYTYSHGLPRLINAICDNVLLSAYSADRQSIDTPFLESVVTQMLMLDDNGESIPSPPRNVGSDVARTVSRTNTQATPPAATRAPVVAQESPSGSVWERRFAALESRLDHTLQAWSARATTNADQAPTTPDRKAQAADATVALGELDRQIEHRLALAKARLAELERHTRSSPAAVAEARMIFSKLKPLVSEAKRTMERAQSMVHGLHDRENEATQLTPKVKLLLDEVRRVLAGLHESLDRIKHGEASAEQVVQRLMRHTRRAQQIADDTNPIGPVSMGSGPIGSRSTLARDPKAVAPIIQHEATACAATLLPSAISGGPQAADQSGLTGAIAENQATLTQLRSLARSSRASAETDAGTHAGTHASTDAAIRDAERLDEISPTDKLASQVDGLVALIAPEND